MDTDKMNQAKTKKPSKHLESQEPAALLSDILPLPEPRFRGRIGNTYADSKADIISLPAAPTGAPNVLAILLDDVGFGQTSTFGGPVQTPTLQRLADEGLRYNRFHTTALCSPTRAAFLSGRNVENQCRPSRAALMTGRLPIRSGIGKAIAAGTSMHADHDLPQSRLSFYWGCSHRAVLINGFVSVVVCTSTCSTQPLLNDLTPSFSPEARFSSPIGLTHPHVRSKAIREGDSLK